MKSFDTLMMRKSESSGAEARDSQILCKRPPNPIFRGERFWERLEGCQISKVTFQAGGGAQWTESKKSRLRWNEAG